MSGPRLATQLANRVDQIAQKLNAASPEAYNAVAADLSALKTDLTTLDQRRITERLNDPSKRAKAKKAAGKKAAKRAK